MARVLVTPCRSVASGHGMREAVACGFITNPGANRAKELELKDHDGSRPGLGVLATGRA